MKIPRKIPSDENTENDNLDSDKFDDNGSSFYRNDSDPFKRSN